MGLKEISALIMYVVDYTWANLSVGGERERESERE